jgi:hypothetical protein
LRPDSACAQNEDRSAEYVLGLQSQLLQVRRAQGVSAATALAQHTGVCWDVECFLLRCGSLFPRDCGGPHAAFPPDYLHSWSLGIAKKFLLVLEAFVLKSRRKTRHCSTIDDVRNRMDSKCKRRRMPGSL